MVAFSPIYETEPVGREDQPCFLNAVAEIRTDLSPREVLRACLAVETALGRERQCRWGPRTIDVDVLWFEGWESHTSELTLPHPRLLERRFVLQPLADLAPDLLIGGKPVIEHLGTLRDSHSVNLWSPPHPDDLPPGSVQNEEGTTA
jgi:2-amino-4-hydroxy-6-hydroxymethyldihydropteridine diphosphokinase